MTGLVITGVIVGLIVLLLLSSLVLRVDITDEVRIKAGMLGIYRDLLSPEKEQKDAQKKKHKKEKKSKRSEKKSKSHKKSDQERKKPKKDFTETVYFVLDLLQAMFSPVKFILRHIRLTNLRLHISIGGEDASNTALTFAGISTAVHNTIAVLKSHIVVRIQEVDIQPDFSAQKTVQDIQFCVRLRLVIIIAGGVGILYNMAKSTFAGNRRGKNKKGKSAQPQGG